MAFKGVKKAYRSQPPPTSKLPELFSRSTFNAELDKREPAVGHKAELQPPPTGILPEFFDGKREVPENPKIEPTPQPPIILPTIPTFFNGNKNTKRRRSGTLSFHKKTLSGRR